jgi:hypothetical protein
MAAQRQIDPLCVEAARYAEDPLGFALDCFKWQTGEGLDVWQADFLRHLGEMVRARHFTGRAPVEPIRLAVASGHGIGKSTLVAILHWWLMVTRPDAKGRVTANTYTQLETTTWAEVQKWWARCRFKHWFEVSGSKVYHKENKAGWFSVPITCAEENSEAFAGQHNRESTSFFLFDEASLIPDKIWEVAEAGLTDGEPMIFAFGNPTRNTGQFYEACFGDRAHRWGARSIDSRSCRFPNHALHDEWIQDHGIDSDFVRVRILGQPPKQSESQLISKDIIAGAQQREVKELPDTPLVAGFDVSGGGSAWNVIRFRRGLDARSIPAIRLAGARTDRPALIARCAALLRDERAGHKIAMMFVDSAFGAPIVERLHVLGFDNVMEVSFGGKSPDPGYANMRAYMWGKELVDWLAKGSLDPEDKKLAIDLSGPGYKRRVAGDGALVVESKADMQARGVPSPDDGDALALTFAQPVSAELGQGADEWSPAAKFGSLGWMR